jgi:multimeric flavodoxin WrbA
MGGNTGRLLLELLAGVAEEGAAVEIVPLEPLKLRPCVACDRCHVTGTCPLDDGYETLKEKLLTCDGFVLASPNYIFSVTAQMKTLFDRMNGLLHCLALEGKYGAAVETSGGGGDEEVTAYMERVMGTLGALSVGAIGSPVAGVRTFPDEAELFTRARELGRNLCRCIRERRPFPQQEEFIAAFRQRMEGLVGYMQDYWTFEHIYWQQKRAGR